MNVVLVVMVGVMTVSYPPPNPPTHQALDVSLGSLVSARSTVPMTDGAVLPLTAPRLQSFRYEACLPLSLVPRKCLFRLVRSVDERSFSARLGSPFHSTILEVPLPEESPEQIQLERALRLADSWKFDVRVFVLVAADAW